MRSFGRCFVEGIEGRGVKEDVKEPEDVDLDD